MEFSGKFVDYLVDDLSKKEELKSIKFVVAYENDIKPTPVTKPIAAVSVKSSEIGNRLSKTLDNGEIVFTDIRPATLVVSIDLYLPYSLGGNEGHRIFDLIVTVIAKGHNQFLSKAVCYDADYDKNSQAICVKTLFSFADSLNPKE